MLRQVTRPANTWGPRISNPRIARSSSVYFNTVWSIVFYEPWSIFIYLFVFFYWHMLIASHHCHVSHLKESLCSFPHVYFAQVTTRRHIVLLFGWCVHPACFVLVRQLLHCVFDGPAHPWLGLAVTSPACRWLRAAGGRDVEIHRYDHTGIRGLISRSSLLG